jgi:hypothetical protein
MGNSPNGVDPDGGWNQLLTIGVSAVAGGIIGGLIDDENPFRGALIGMAGGAAIGYGISYINWNNLGGLFKGNELLPPPKISTEKAIAYMNAASRELISNLESEGLPRSSLRDNVPLIPDFHGLTITSQRISENQNTTSSYFSITNSRNDLLLTGYFLEPGGPSSTQRGSDRRIMPGIYPVVPYNSEDHPNTFQILNVPGRTAILIHSGNFHNDTSGCFLPGGTNSPCYVGSSGAQGLSSVNYMNYIRSIINDFGTNGVRIDVREIHRPRFRH